MCVVTLAIKTFFLLCVCIWSIFVPAFTHTMVQYTVCTYNVNQYYYTISANFRVVKSGEHVVVVESNQHTKALCSGESSGDPSTAAMHYGPRINRITELTE